MSITSIDIRFSGAGMNTNYQPRKASYIIVAVLQFDNSKRKKCVYQEDFMSDKGEVKIFREFTEDECKTLH